MEVGKSRWRRLFLVRAFMLCYLKAEGKNTREQKREEERVNSSFYQDPTLKMNPVS
jgi:hypothetical protein